MLGRLVFAALFCAMLGWSLPVQAHGGGLDGLGCHHDRQIGGYHCHQGSLAGQFFGSKAEARRSIDGASAPAAHTCCKICKKGKPCGNSCIARNKTCRKGPGCAC